MKTGTNEIIKAQYEAQDYADTVKARVQAMLDAIVPTNKQDAWYTGRKENH
jgi:hypothetical protein